MVGVPKHEKKQADAFKTFFRQEGQCNQSWVVSLVGLWQRTREVACSIQAIETKWHSVQIAFAANGGQHAIYATAPERPPERHRPLATARARRMLSLPAHAPGFCTSTFMCPDPPFQAPRCGGHCRLVARHLRLHSSQDPRGLPLRYSCLSSAWPVAA